MKRVLISFLLILSVAASSVPAMALADTDVIVGIAGELGNAGVWINGVRSRTVKTSLDLENLMEMRPSEQIFLAFGSKDFKWRDSSFGKTVTMDMIRQHRIVVGCERQTGDGVEVLKKVSIAEREGRVGILFEFADTVRAVESVQFELAAYVRADDGASVSSAFTLKGSIRNFRTLATSYGGVVRLGAGRMAAADNSYDSLTFDVGAGVTVQSAVQEADVVYGVASLRPVPADLRARHPSLEHMIALDAINLSGRVTLNADPSYYVYNSNMAYLGRGDEPLPLSPRYYLSAQPI